MYVCMLHQKKNIYIYVAPKKKKNIYIYISYTKNRLFNFFMQETFAVRSRWYIDMALTN